MTAKIIPTTKLPVNRVVAKVAPSSLNAVNDSISKGGKAASFVPKIILPIL